MADTGVPLSYVRRAAARSSLGHLTRWALKRIIAYPCRPQVARQPAALPTGGAAALAGAGDHDAAGHAEGRRSGVGGGYGLGVGNDDGAEAEAHGAGAVAEKDTGAGEVAVAARGGNRHP